MINVAIVGGTGYTGGELLRLLANHSEAKVELVTSRKLVGKPLSSVHPHIKGLYSQNFESPSAKEIADRCDIVFTAVPHGTAMDWVPDLLNAGTRVIDLSADYRLSIEVFEKTYGIKHKAPKEAVFGLTELHPEVASAKLVGNPGCYPTGATLAVAPLAKAGIVDRVIFDSKSGISGAGAEPTETSHYPNMAENVIPYRLTTHRHVPEIKQELTRLSPGIRINFTPHVVPSVRGILTTAHVIINKEAIDRIRGRTELAEIYSNFYKNAHFIRMSDSMPKLSSVRGSNFCDIYFEFENGDDRLVVISAIDNLVKGASGQAIQNMNLMAGLDERTGLWLPGMAP
ncbi:MAG: N-acetyl-gamma-glutamyl-phosphate reductase [Methanotrichaceae archaeon]|nr:N-acetyl-gamma-glutamyl-phosphate reductase [Methanotrichaceae archaeon]